MLEIDTFVESSEPASVSIVLVHMTFGLEFGVWHAVDANTHDVALVIDLTFIMSGRLLPGVNYLLWSNGEIEELRDASLDDILM